MECTVSWAGEARFIASTGSGHEVRMEGGAGELGGKNQFPRPMEMILAGAGGCTAYDIVVLLRREGYAVEGCKIRLDAERAGSEPKVFTRIHYHYTVSGRDIEPDAVARAIALSAGKYSSAANMLCKTAQLVHDFEVVNAV
ncbi:OsmC family protein [Uliginosibacterium sp. 31-16]|uniref:OsmC family protein n=1 Tax=Uliginosibacterium sp. 31-16 TaxID=3068315 RepID=UPI00273FF2BC|nr:OsmC family protein [Uliginosibacterium sp. 31-16]MDP5240822.1 OsmC family protein [Uliginosibacterium sp. 31-16]